MPRRVRKALPKRNKGNSYLYTTIGLREKTKVMAGLEWCGGPEEEKITAPPIEEKEKIAIDIAKDSIVNAKNPFVCFSGGKKSTVLLHLIKRAYEGTLNVLHVDTTVEFDNIYLYIEKMRKLWRFNLVRERRGNIEDIRIAGNREECCRKLKTEPLENAIEKYRIDCLFAGRTRDEKEGGRFVSEGNDHYGVHPILHFTERDIWDYIRKYSLPYCSLYDQGYRKLDCKPCSKIVSEENESNSHEQEMIKDRLRGLGYL